MSPPSVPSSAGSCGSYVKLPSAPPLSRSSSFAVEPPVKIFDELPMATVVSVSESEVADITPLLLSYTIDLQYKQFKWRLVKKATQVLHLHLSLKKRALIEELQVKQEQVKDWLLHLGLGEHAAFMHEDDESVPVQREDSSCTKNRNVPSKAALPILRPVLQGHRSFYMNAKLAMQQYLNHFLGNLDIVNSREVCKFLEVSLISFAPVYGPKLKENFLAVKHLRKIRKLPRDKSCACNWFDCCKGNWQKVWAVLKPGFLALLEDPFGTELLDIIVFDVLSESNEKGGSLVPLAKEMKGRNPLRLAFEVCHGDRTIEFRTTNSCKVKEWTDAINNVTLPTEGWCSPHRFGSFAPQRGLTDDDSHVQWLIDGEAAFDAIASSIEHAKSEIYITDWWLCPELYMRRPFHKHGSSRLDVLMEEKAKQGVKIYILLYKEVGIALKINSQYSKRRLLSIHENVKVLRYPDHLPMGVYLWSHHEKIVVVDNRVCYIGGLDLCFGRYDTAEHKLGDFPPLIWPGKDYYNPRESEPNSWEDTTKDELDREKYPRMPWHDVHCALWGPACRDVARHFVQRWNYAKRNKAPNEQKIPLLIPQHHMVIPHYMGMPREICIQKEEHGNLVTSNTPPPSSYEDVPLLLPKEPEESSISNGNQKEGDDEWWEKQEHSDQVEHEDVAGQVGPRTRCCCQVIRSVSQWSAGTNQTEQSIHNAYLSLIEKAEHFIYIENQFFISGLSGDDTIQNRILEALYKRILQAKEENRCFRVIIVIPLLPGFQGGLDDNGAASVRALIHWQYRTISRGPNSILQRLCSMLGSEPSNYISFYGLRTYGHLSDKGLLATNQVYVHSKLMIVDDRVVLLGSANINDRSLLGSRDSEIGVVIEDKEFVNSFMNGKPWRAGRFARSLRLSLWSEHLGIDAAEIDNIYDPVRNSTYKDIWMKTAQANSKIYDDVFACIPNDHIHSRANIRRSASYWKDRLGHTTIDIGIAPDKQGAQWSGERQSTDTVKSLHSIRGHLVSFPLEFMKNENLLPFFIEGEFYVSPQVFH